MKNLIYTISTIVIFVGYTDKAKAQCGAISMPYQANFKSSCWDLSSPDVVDDAVSLLDFNFYNNNTGIITASVDSIVISQDAVLKFKWSHGLDHNPTIYHDSLALRIRRVGATNWTTIWNKYGVSFNSRDGSDYNSPGSFVSEEIFLDFEYTGDTIELQFIGKGASGLTFSADATIAFLSITPHLCNTVIQAPFFESFDDSIWNVETIISNPSRVDSCWINSPKRDKFRYFITSSTAITNTFNYSWIVLSGPTPSSNTGPSADHTGGGKYLYTEGTLNPAGINGVDKASLITPRIDISNLTQPELSFWYHMYGDSIRTLYIDLYDGNTWSTIDSIVGQQQTATTDPWFQRNVNLNTTIDTIRVRFRANWGNHFSCDLAIDDFSIQCAQQVVPSISYTATQTTTTSTSATFDFDASGTTNGVNYTWDFGSGVIKNGQQVTHTYTNFGATDTVKLTVDDGGCGAITDSAFTINVSGIGFEENTALANVKIFPNPTKGNITIELDKIQKNISVRIISFYGQIITEKQFINTGTFKMDFEAAKGLYILQLETDSGLVSTHKILKE